MLNILAEGSIQLVVNLKGGFVGGQNYIVSSDMSMLKNTSPQGIL